MKAVEMMKKAIRDSKVNEGCWKWKATKAGLDWEYCDIRFNFSIFDELENKVVKFEDPVSDVSAVVIVATEEQAWLCNGYHDFVKTVDEAIYWAARKMIASANSLY